MKYSTSSADGTSTTEFPSTSIAMPTYLLAFVVSDFDYNSWYPINNKYSQRVYSVPSLTRHLRQSVVYSVEFLNILERFLNGFTYKLPKLYSVAVPDHGSAMENYVSRNLL